MTPDTAIASRERACRSALHASPDDPAALLALGELLCRTARADEALQLARDALARRPHSAPHRQNLGVMLLRSGAVDDAIAAFEAALAGDPERGECALHLATALRLRNRHADAIDALRHAIDRNPTLVGAWKSLASVFAETGSWQEADAAYRGLDERGVRDTQTRIAHAFVLRRLGAVEQAIALLRSVPPDDPDASRAAFNLSDLLLLTGQLREGFALSPARWELQYARSDGRTTLMRDARPPGLSPRQWDGSPLGPGRLLVWHEQGYGDTIHFCRYLERIASGSRVLAAVPPALLRLIASIPGVEAVGPLDRIPPHDRHCPFMDLPRVLGTTLDTIPSAGGYLRADPVARDRWRTVLGQTRGLTVGLCWAGDRRSTFPAFAATDAIRSIPLALFERMFGLAGVRFVSLQKGTPQREIAVSRLPLIDHTDRLSDFADTAALVAALDLVITVDTSVAHLAGALGKPVWLLNRMDTDWRWHGDGADSPWYRSLRLFRQTVRHSWDAPINAVRAALLTRLASPPAPDFP